jgi:ferredoxin
MSTDTTDVETNQAGRPAPEPRPRKHRVDELIERVIGPLAQPLMDVQRMQRLWIVPTRPRFLRRHPPPLKPWLEPIGEIPEELKTQPGIRKDAALEQEAFETKPMPDFLRLHFPTIQYVVKRGWRSNLPVAPRVVRAGRRVAAVNRKPVSGAAADIDSARLTRELTEYALSIGLSAIGFTHWDDKYIYDEYRGTNVGDTAIVLIEEQNWERTQEAPGPVSERGAMTGYVEILRRAAMLVEYLKERGYAAQSHGLQGKGQMIPFAVEAGLGQLGLNGQLLTPVAGSRCRISMLDTNAPLLHDAPVDFGIEGICDRCRVCVRRCPSGAITTVRKPSRGVYKAKVNTGRCFPVIAQTDACGVCMKVCPIQRYGLEAVIDEYKRSGKILGKATDELEGFYWPPDGNYYPAGVRPKLSKEFLEPYPPGAELDLTRETAPPGAPIIFK